MCTTGAVGIFLNDSFLILAVSALGCSSPRASTYRALAASVESLTGSGRYSTLTATRKAYKASVSNFRTWRKRLLEALALSYLALPPHN